MGNYFGVDIKNVNQQWIKDHSKIDLKPTKEYLLIVKHFKYSLKRSEKQMEKVFPIKHVELKQIPVVKSKATKIERFIVKKFKESLKRSERIMEKMFPVKGVTKLREYKPQKTIDQRHLLVRFEYVEDQEPSPLYNLVYPKNMLIKK